MNGEEVPPTDKYGSSNADTDIDPVPASPYSSIIFIGRERELAQFEQLRTHPQQWILNIRGEGGIGKTQLLLKLIENVQEAGARVTRNLIDFYLTSNKLERGILHNIADQLGPENFRGFESMVDRLQDNPDALDLTREAFIEDYRKLSAHEIVLVFDTSEEASDAARRFLTVMLPRLKHACPRTICIVAGRPFLPNSNDKIPNALDIPAAATMTLNLKGLSANQIDEYLKAKHIEIDAEILDLIETRTKGRPILVALIVDWLTYGHVAEELLNYEPRQFEREMVKRVMSLTFPEDRAILAMAHLYRRFNANVLANILDEPVETAHQLIESLSRFSFVKYRPATDIAASSCLLHDEMRRLVNAYVWPLIDPEPDGDYRTEWNCKILHYYDESLAHITSPLEQQNFQLEKLYYQLDCDLARAFQNSHVLFETTNDPDFREQINAEVERVKGKLNESMLREHESRLASVLYYDRNLKDQAIQKWEMLLQDPKIELILEGQVRARLVEAYAEKDETQKAESFGEECERWFTQSIEQAHQKPDTLASLEQSFGELLTNRGLAYRRQGEIDQAAAYYERSNTHFAKLKSATALGLTAKTKTQLAYVYHLSGRHNEALTACETAIRISKKLKNNSQLGFSYNVYGIIHAGQLREDDAINYFRMAMNAFEEAESKQGKALVSMAHGQMLSQREWYRTRFYGNYDNYYQTSAETKDSRMYQDAAQLFDTSIRLLREIDDDGYRCEALNDKGVLLRRQGKFDEALESHAESLKLARQIPLKYLESDNLRNTGLINMLRGEKQRALVNASEAAEIATRIGYIQCLARCQRIIADIKFAENSFDAAFVAAAESCINILERDRFSLSFTPARKELYYNDWLNWISDMIMALPSFELVEDKCNYLIQRWQESILSEKDPLRTSFIGRMEALIEDYKLEHSNW